MATGKEIPVQSLRLLFVALNLKSKSYLKEALKIEKKMIEDKRIESISLLIQFIITNIIEVLEKNVWNM